VAYTRKPKFHVACLVSVRRFIVRMYYRPIGL
jgi:hypothetical protein